jgi:hypothetical protein
MRPLLALAVLAAFAAAAPVPKALKAKPNVLTGTWQQVNAGREWFKFNDDGTMSTWVTESPGSPVPFTYAVVADANPPYMTWTSKGSTTPSYHCLFDFDGDTLRLNYGSPGSLPASVTAATGHPLLMTRQPSK